MTVGRSATMARWWAVVVLGAALALLFAWLGRLAGVPAGTVLRIGAAVAALSWLVVLVTVPWNLYFAARRVVADAALSRERGIAVPPDRDAEAARIAHRMLRFAIGAHVVTAAVTAVAALVSGAYAGFYVAGFFLLSTVVRPAAAYFAHLRARLAVLGRESTHPRDDVVTLRSEVGGLADSVKDLRAAVERIHHDDLAGLRKQVRATDDELRRTVRRIGSALDSVSDHQELLTGIRALVRMIRSDPA